MDRCQELERGVVRMYWRPELSFGKVWEFKPIVDVSVGRVAFRFRNLRDAAKFLQGLDAPQCEPWEVSPWEHSDFERAGVLSAAENRCLQRRMAPLFQSLTEDLAEKGSRG